MRSFLVLAALVVGWVSCIESAWPSSFKRTAALIQQGDLSDLQYFCRLYSKQKGNLQKKYEPLWIRHCFGSMPYANASIYENYRKLTFKDFSPQKAQTDFLNRVLQSYRSEYIDSAAIGAASRSIDSREALTREYRAFRFSSKRPWTIPPSSRVHAALVLQNPATVGIPVRFGWEFPNGAKAVRSDGEPFTDVWYKLPNDSFSKLIVNPVDRYMGTINLRGEIYTVAIDLDSDRLADWVMTNDGLWETILVSPKGMRLWQEWLAGFNPLCLFPENGGAPGLELMPSRMGSEYPGSISACDLNVGAIADGGPPAPSRQGMPTDLNRRLCEQAKLSFPQELCQQYGTSGGGGQPPLYALSDGYALCIGGCYLQFAACTAGCARSGPRMILCGAACWTAGNDCLAGCEQDAEASEARSNRGGDDTKSPDSAGGEANGDVSCSPSPCDTDGDGVNDAEDTTGDGYANVSCNPCSNGNDQGTGEGNPGPDPTDEQRIAAYCSSLKPSQPALCESFAAPDNKCDDPFINPDPTIALVTYLSPEDASATILPNTTRLPKCLSVPERTSVFSLSDIGNSGHEGCGDIQENAETGRDLYNCVYGRDDGTAIGIAFSSLIGIEICDPRVCR